LTFSIFFVNHLDLINNSNKISLFLYTQGGNTLAGWRIVNLIHQFCEELEIIIPAKAHSTGTLICLGAHKIIMTKQATLGPIDPSINHPLAPQIPDMPGIPGIQKTVPVSVEAINGYLEFVKQEIGDNKTNISNIISKLTDLIHPLVLGQVYRSKTQIKMLAERLLKRQFSDKIKIDKVISLLVSESGSHDYTINRKEAKEELGLNIEKPDVILYQKIKLIYDDIYNELELSKSYDPKSYLGTENTKTYAFRRGLIESIEGGSDVFVSEGVLNKMQLQSPVGVQIGVQDNRTFEGWRHENVSS
jgi:hypothetical protein